MSGGIEISESGLSDLFSGQTVRVCPRWDFRTEMTVASIWLLLGAALLTVAIVCTVRGGVRDADFASWLGVAACSMILLVHGMISITRLPRLRSTYAFSDSCLRQISKTGEERFLPVNEVASVRFDWVRTCDTVISKSGTRISFWYELPECSVMRSFCHAAAALNGLGATGERLVDLFKSALSRHGRITFREPFSISAVFSFTVALVLAFFLLRFALFAGDATLWWRGAGLLAGAFLLWFAAFGFWLMITGRRLTITFHAAGFNLSGRRGEVQSVRWEEIAQVIEDPDTDDDPILRVISADGRELAAISTEFRELYAIAYFVEHMRRERNLPCRQAN